MFSKDQTLSQANEFAAGAARERVGKTGPTHAEVQYYMDVARRLRSEAFANFIRRAYAKLFQGGVAEDSSPVQPSQTHTPHRA